MDERTREALNWQWGIERPYFRLDQIQDGYSSSWTRTSQSYTGRHLPYGILPNCVYIWYKVMQRKLLGSFFRTRCIYRVIYSSVSLWPDTSKLIPALTPARQTGTRFTYPPGGIEGWVDLGCWVHTETVIHPSSNRVRCRATSLIENNTLTTTPLGLHHAVIQQNIRALGG